MVAGFCLQSAGQPGEGEGAVEDLPARIPDGEHHSQEDEPFLIPHGKHIEGRYKERHNTILRRMRLAL